MYSFICILYGIKKTDAFIFVLGNPWRQCYGSMGLLSACVRGCACVCGPQELQNSILSLSTKILVGCDEAVETLQQVTTALINSDIPDRETRCEPISHLAFPHVPYTLRTVSLNPANSSLGLGDLAQKK